MESANIYQTHCGNGEVLSAGAASSSSEGNAYGESNGSRERQSSWCRGAKRLLAFRFSRPSKARRELNDHALVASETEAQYDEPVRLWPWNGGSKLISLAEMNKYSAIQIFGMAEDLWAVRFSPPALKSPEEMTIWRQAVKAKALSIWREAKRLNLTASMKQAGRIYNGDDDDTQDEIEDAIDGLRSRLVDELEELKFLYIAPDRFGYYNKTDLFGEDVKSRFPSANAEITEAGNSFALDRYGACVFHLSRALEISVRVVFVSLGMQPRVWAITRWHSLVQRIGGKIERNNQVRSEDADWQKDRHFYEKIHAFLSAATNPLRNSSVHVDVIYTDEQSVRPVWLGVEAFMRHLATKLKE